MHLGLGTVVAGLVLIGAASGSGVVVDLSTRGGGKWTYASQNGTVRGPATVPGAIHTDLLANGVIGDPFVGYDPVGAMKWVALDNWTYHGEFNVDASVLDLAHVLLVMEGVDTVADVFLNKGKIAHVSNMFHRSRLDVKKWLRAGANVIEFRFRSKPSLASEGLARCPAIAPGGYCPTKVPSKEQHGFNNFNYIRTEQCSASWDWGPGFAPVGVWRDIYIHAFDGVVVRDLVVTTEAPSLRLGLAPGLTPASPAWAKRAAMGRHTSAAERATAEWTVTAKVFLDAGADNLFNLTVWGEDDADGGDEPEDGAREAHGADVSGTVRCEVPGVGSGEARATVAAGASAEVTVEIKGVKGVSPWMPFGYGDQPLYLLTATFTPDSDMPRASVLRRDGAAPSSTPSSSLQSSSPSSAPSSTSSSVPPPPVPVIPPTDGSLSRRFGFRVVELVQDYLPGPDKPTSKSYYSRVNGLPIVWHGSNFVPTDAFQSRVNRSTLAVFVAGLRAAGQNAVRVWGGGLYGKQAVYDLMDEAGVMIWHDSMFSDAFYAVPGAFLQSVAKEVRDSVKRLASSPSVAVWAGNNENEGHYKPGGEDTQYYGVLTFNTILSNVTAVDHSRPLSGSSPSCGNETASYPACPDVHTLWSGDDHAYLYHDDPWLGAVVFPRSRAQTEWGLQSWPSFETLKRYIPEQDWYYYSPTMIRRNHHPSGPEEIVWQIGLHWRLPKALGVNASDPKGFRQMLYLTQVYQAYAYQYEIHHFRRIRSDCDDETSGCTQGGMLYWQLQNNWPGASWATIDYTGRSQASWYAVKRAYAPLTAVPFLVPAQRANSSIFDDDATLGVTPVNDDPASARAGRVRITCYTWADGRKGTAEHGLNFTVGAANATQALNRTLGSVRAAAGCAGANGTVLEVGLVSDSGEPLAPPSAILTDDFVSSPGLKDPRLAVTSVTSLGPAADHPPPEFASTAYGPTIWRETFRGNAFQVSLAAAHPAAFVWLATDADGLWSDNAMHILEGGSTQAVTFYARSATDTKAVADSLTVMSTWDSAEY